MENHNDRRSFIKKVALGAAAIGLAPVSGALASGISGTPDSPVDAISGPTKKSKGKSVMGLRCEPLETVRIGLIGTGMRGETALNRLLQIEGVEIKAICDLVPDFLQNAGLQITGSGRPPADEYGGEEDWKKICERDDIDLIYNCTPWYLHTPISVYAMKHGKHTAVEVPAAFTVDECWELVNTAEETQRHCMMLENCCYDFFELATLNMARNGEFGDVLHGEGAYIHDLRWLKFATLEEGGYYNRWRLEYSKKHTGNPYPTHGLGPIAQIMGINRGDSFDFLTSNSTRQAAMTLYAIEKYGKDSPEARQEYKLGDMNSTLIHTVKGKTILIQHDTTSPRPYSRIHLISGTAGMAVKYPEERIAIKPNPEIYLSPEEQQAILKKYEHPMATQIGEIARRVGGHGGMDFIMDYRLIHCLRNGLPLDQDVYDAAAWSCIIELSEKSVLANGSAVAIPDFTRGAWKNAAPLPVLSLF